MTKYAKSIHIWTSVYIIIFLLVYILHMNTLTLALPFISEQKLKYITMIYIKVTGLNRIYNEFDDN